jgi:hypothetical protein
MISSAQCSHKFSAETMPFGLSNNNVKLPEITASSGPLAFLLPMSLSELSVICAEILATAIILALM